LISYPDYIITVPSYTSKRRRTKIRNFKLRAGHQHRLSGLINNFMSTIEFLKGWFRLRLAHGLAPVFGGVRFRCCCYLFLLCLSSFCVFCQMLPVFLDCPFLIFSSGFSTKSLKIPKRVIRSCKSKKDRPYNGQKKTGAELSCPGIVNSSCSTCGTRLTLIYFKS